MLKIPQKYSEIEDRYITPSLACRLLFSATGHLFIKLAKGRTPLQCTWQRREGESRRAEWTVIIKQDEGNERQYYHV